MSESEIGFKIQGKFYPWVILDNWRQQDNRLAVKVAGCSVRQMLSADSDNSTANFAFAAVAFWRENPQASEDDVFRYISGLTAKDLELVGFDSLGKDDDAGPPDETPGSDSSENTGQSSEPIQEKSDQKTSGVPDLQPTGTSGPPSPSESSPTAS